MELLERLRKYFDTQTFAKVFPREMVLLDSGTISPAHFNRILSDKINLLDNVSEGETVKLGINIRGREWTNSTGNLNI